MMRPAQCCALDMGVRGCSRERWQIVCAHLRSGLVTGGEFDQGRFAKRCPPGPKTSLASYCATISEDRCQRIFSLAFAFPI